MYHGSGELFVQAGKRIVSREHLYLLLPVLRVGPCLYWHCCDWSVTLFVIWGGIQVLPGLNLCIFLRKRVLLQLSLLFGGE